MCGTVASVCQRPQCEALDFDTPFPLQDANIKARVPLETGQPKFLTSEQSGLSGYFLSVDRRAVLLGMRVGGVWLGESGLHMADGGREVAGKGAEKGSKQDAR